VKLSCVASTRSRLRTSAGSRRSSSDVIEWPCPRPAVDDDIRSDRNAPRGAFTSASCIERATGTTFGSRSATLRFDARLLRFQTTLQHRQRRQRGVASVGGFHLLPAPRCFREPRRTNVGNCAFPASAINAKHWSAFVDHCHIDCAIFLSNIVDRTFRRVLGRCVERHVFTADDLHRGVARV
jgi:hypothetical protein